ncbi:MAG: Methyltransferase type 11 [Mucilaginibacter sp.]|nr:Methyltransferase type 11 [Mucilaginibacter sp.]
MNKINYLNVGCGNKFHKDWVNIDMSSNSQYVIAVNLLNGIPFDDNSFDVVYHSQVLEHIPKNEARDFIKECYRILKPGGIVRVVVPDLENITREYLRLLDANWQGSSKEEEANYEWIVLEMYDQTVRNKKGGLMYEYLKQKEIVNEAYILKRVGFIGEGITSFTKMGAMEKVNVIFSKISSRVRSTSFIGDTIKRLKLKAKKVFLSNNDKLFIKIGEFRLAGEVHYWMYDKYSLKRLLLSCGFDDIELMSPSKSKIHDWDKYELDIKNGLAHDPTSLFMEAVKPPIRN